MLWQLFLIGCVIWLLVIRWQNRGKRRMTENLTTDLPAIPVLGISHLFAGTDDEGRMDVIKQIGYDAIKHGGLNYTWHGHRLFLNCTDPEVSEFVSKTCMEKHDILRFTRLIIGNGSIFAPVSIWRPRRKLMAPTFNMKNLNQFVNVFAKQSEDLVKNLKTSSLNGTFSIWKNVTSYTMDSICETTLGVKLGIQKQPHHPFLKNFEIAAELIASRLFQPWFYNNFVYKFTSYYTQTMAASEYMNNFVKKIIVQKMNEIEENKKQENTKMESNNETQKSSKTFVQLMMELSENCSELELREESMVMVVAGTDTSAAGVCFAVLMLSRHPDIQEKVYQEIQEVLGDTDRPITAEDLPNLKYLDVFLKETLRMYPPVPVIARITDKDVVFPNGLKVVAGVGISLHIWGTHRNPKYWGDDAEVFRPERFFDSPPTHPSAYMPFGVGHRSCLGFQYATLSMKTALVAMVRKYRILPADNAMKNGTKPVRVKYRVMLMHVNNFKVQLESRN